MNSLDLSFDVVVIGSGAAGSAVSWLLSKSKDLKIACLEQGKFTLPSNYPSNFADWESRLLENFSYKPSDRNSWADYEIDDSESPIKIANFNGVGGSTVLFSGHFPRLRPSDFRTRDLDNVAENWPISYQDLEPYYDLNDFQTGVAGLVGDPAYPDIKSNLLPPIPLGLLGERVADGLNKLSWHWWPSYSAINTSDRGPRPKCINLGPCNSGCSQGAKSSADVTYWPQAIHNGVKLFPSSRAVKLELDKRQTKVVGLRFIDENGNSGLIEAKIFVIACNGVGTPRFLLANATSKFPNGIGNNHDLLGRNLMLHPLAYLEGTVSEDLYSSIGPQGCCLQSQEFYETQPTALFKRGFTMQVLRSPGPLETARQGIRRKKISFGPKFHDEFRKYFNRTISLSMIAEDLPEVMNCVKLSSKVDSSGLPIPKVVYKVSQNTKEILKFSLSKGRELFRAIGAEESISFAPVSFAGWHLMGTARMGNGPRNSVTDQFGRIHEIENLYVADSSLFVTSGSVNPTSTIQALALYIADHIAERLRGEKYVK
jgi:choline dehydrogenase-like flavoprotein